jgi:uroporphyrin-III C-methyltransferase
MNESTNFAMMRPGAPVLEPGHVWLAGAGPGDPGLLTLDCLAGLAQADVVVHDALIDPRVLAMAGPRTRLEFAGKRAGKPSSAQADISKRLIELAREGRRVLRLKGGDPLVFGRGGEEAIALAQAGVPFRIIPGITSALGAMAAALIPATMRGVNRALVFAAGYGADHVAGHDWAALAKTGAPIVLYMAVQNLGAIAAELMKGGLAAETPVAAIGSATMADQQILISTLARAEADLHAADIPTPIIFVVGDIVTVREQLLQAAQSRGG